MFLYDAGVVRKQLLRVARDWLDERGYDDWTLEDILAHVGWRGPFPFFKTKDDLVLACLKAQRQRQFFKQRYILIVKALVLKWRE